MNVIITPTIIFLTLSLLISSCANFEETHSKISINKELYTLNTTSTGIMIIDCQDKNYRIQISDYIIEGIVDDVCYTFNKEENGIITRVHIKIDKYIKGNPLDTEKIELFIAGGTTGNLTQITEDNPAFREGERIRVYLCKNCNGNYQIVCSNLGLELLNGQNILDTGN